MSIYLLTVAAVIPWGHPSISVNNNNGGTPWSQQIYFSRFGWNTVMQFQAVLWSNSQIRFCYIDRMILWGQWYPCFERLVMSTLGFIARMASLICSQRFTIADLLAASMTAKPISSTYLWPSIVVFKQETYHATGQRSTDWSMPAWHICNLYRYSPFGRISVGVKIKVHNVFYTHTSIYSELILTMVSNMYYNFLDFLTQ